MASSIRRGADLSFSAAIVFPPIFLLILYHKKTNKERKNLREALKNITEHGIIISLLELNIFYNKQQVRFCFSAKTQVPLHLLFIVDDKFV